MRDYNELFKEIAQYRAIKAEAEAELERLEAIVKERMALDNLDEIIGDEHKATYKPVVSNRFDSKSFQTDHKALYDAYKRPSTSMRFTFA